jgi:hypothetical protein
MSRESPDRTAPWARTVHGAAIPSRPTKIAETQQHEASAPAPDMFDVITYFLNRGDSWTVIASIGFWTDTSTRKALTARALKRWYENERTRKSARKRPKAAT